MQVLAAEVGEGKASEVQDALLARRPTLAHQLHGRPSQVSQPAGCCSHPKPSSACEPPAVNGPLCMCCGALQLSNTLATQQLRDLGRDPDNQGGLRSAAVAAGWPPRHAAQARSCAPGGAVSCWGRIALQRRICQPAPLSAKWAVRSASPANAGSHGTPAAAIAASAPTGFPAPRTGSCIEVLHSLLGAFPSSVAPQVSQNFRWQVIMGLIAAA